VTDRVTGTYCERPGVPQGTTLPGVETDDEDRIVVHVDLDCFYAACERLREPALEGEPVVVGMGYEEGQPDGAVATASYEAREHGVESAQAISTALERLPRAVDHTPDSAERTSGSEQETAPDGDEREDADDVGHYRPVDMEYYEAIAGEIKAILHDCAETVREVSIDEAYLDVTDRTDWSVVEGYARHVKQRIDREVGLTASVGVAPTMHAAKVASDHDKPDGLVVVEPGDVEDFLAPLPIDDLHGIGPVTAGTLREAGIETVADLAEADREWVQEQWGDRGLELHDRARGVDPRGVEPRGRPKSLSRESSLGGAEDDSERVQERVRTLAQAVAERARSKAALYRTIGIKVVLPPFDVNTRARSLPGPVDDPELVESVALDLLEEFAEATPRKVGVRVSNLSFADADQSTLGGWDGAAASDESEDGGAVASDDPGDYSAEVPENAGDDAVGLAVDDGDDAAGDSAAARLPEALDDRAPAPEQPDGDSQPTETDPSEGELPGQSVLDRVWSDGPAETGDPEPIGQPPDQTTLSEFE
jgi:DNA polymerase IV (DinB-like DNA polymerase)